MIMPSRLTQRVMIAIAGFVAVLLIVAADAADSARFGSTEAAASRVWWVGSLPVDEVERPAPPTAAFSRKPIEEVRSMLLQWLALTRVDDATARDITRLWADRQELSQLTAEETLDRVIESMAQADPVVREVTIAARSGRIELPLNLEGPRSEPFARDQLQLFAARSLTQHRRYDEALTMLESLDATAVVDPASLFFYRATCRLKLLKLSEAGDDLTLLLNSTLDVPARFRALGELMLQETTKPNEGLPQVARLMSDVHRRLDLQNTDDPVQKREEEVIAALDKLLKDMENQQQQQQQQQQGQGSGQSQPGEQGAQQSELRTGTPRTGDADHKELTENGSWGMLDQQAEARARELIRQQFPPNFLDAISRYTRRIAEQKE